MSGTDILSTPGDPRPVVQTRVARGGREGTSGKATLADGAGPGRRGRTRRHSSPSGGSGPRVPGDRALWTLDARERPPGVAGPAGLAAAASAVALWPYTSVIRPGAWTFTVVSVILVVALVGMAVRRWQRHRRAALRSLLAMLGQAVAATTLLTAVIAPEGAFMGLLPTTTTLEHFGLLAGQAYQEVLFGSAPLDDTPALRAMLGIGFAVIAILLDHLVTERLSLLAGLVVATVGAVPMIVTLGDANLVWFVMLAVLLLLLLRHGVRHGRTGPRRASAPIAIGVGAGAVALALVVTPGLPVSATWIGVGASVELNPTLRLGEDLRRPTASEVMTVATTAQIAPYLRIATLSRFDGDVWHPDESELTPLADGFGAPEWTDAIATREQRTSIRVLGVSSSWLPVPYPATSVQGVGGNWRVMPINRTVSSRTADASGEDYTVTSAVVAPTLEQIKASRAAVAPGALATLEEIPEVVARTAAEVTADAETDYDRLIALQSWFRAEFDYSLETPVEEGFDGTGAEAVARFLEVRAGYCIHFAGAFALMAQSMDMPVRIVVGYLPGHPTEEKRGDEFVYSVSSDQLHAWPEVHFDGIGWVPFEPTTSLGVPTSFLPGQTSGGTGTAPATPAPSTAPSPAATGGPELERDDVDGQAVGGDSLRRLDPAPVMLVTAVILVVVLLPGAFRRGVRYVRRRRAARGDAYAAWTEVRATLVDLGLPVSDAETPRTRGAHLVERGADAVAVQRLVGAVERASFARSPGETGDLSDALRSVLDALGRSVDGRDRVRALLLPRSLVAQSPARATVMA